MAINPLLKDFNLPLKDSKLRLKHFKIRPKDSNLPLKAFRVLLGGSYLLLKDFNVLLEGFYLRQCRHVQAQYCKLLYSLGLKAASLIKQMFKNSLL